MQKYLYLSMILLFSLTELFAQPDTLKEAALSEFKKEHYDEAIAILEQALNKSPSDAEIYYYLGFFNHYRAYDSRPLIGYDFSHSEKIFNYLDKAIELNPNYGDAKYFYGAECSGNAFVTMQNYDLQQLKYFYKLAFEKGAYPPWLLEYGRNILVSCDKNAILFTGGNSDFDVCSYLQLIENLRTDITLIPIGNIDRPWYVKFLADGLPGGAKKILIKLTEDQIMDIHPFKWDTTMIMIPLSKRLQTKYNHDKDYAMHWVIEPDLSSGRNHSKIAGEAEKQRTYLSPQRAILMQIIEDNLTLRPIYFSTLVGPSFTGGLDSYFQNCGLVSQLLPFQTEQTEYTDNYNKIIQLLQNQNLKDYSSIIDNNIPRISGMVYRYYYEYLNLANYLKENNEMANLEILIQQFKENIVVGFNSNYEKRFEIELERIVN